MEQENLLSWILNNKTNLRKFLTFDMLGYIYRKELKVLAKVYVLPVRVHIRLTIQNISRTYD